MGGSKWCRLSLGAFRTSPIPNLQALSGEPPLSIRRDQLALQFYCKLYSNIKNPAYNKIFNNTNPLFQRNSKYYSTSQFTSTPSNSNSQHLQLFHCTIQIIQNTSMDTT